MLAIIPDPHVHDVDATPEEAWSCMAGRAQLKNAHAQERRTLLLIIGALASGYFPAAIHRNHHTMATELREEMRKLVGAESLGQVTVANKLRESFELIAHVKPMLHLVESSEPERKDYLQRLIDAANDKDAA